MLDFLLICHNNADYFVNIFPKILQSIKILEPNFYIYENNSTDNTKHILTHYQKKIPNFYLLSENTEYFSNRYKNICIARNKLLDFYRTTKNNNDNDNIWCVLFDTNVIFNSKSVTELINNSIYGADMLCSYTTYYNLNSNNNYYYDLLALNYGKYFYQKNIDFNRIKNDSNLYKNDLIVQIESGFGGLVLINKDIILQNNWHLVKHKETNHINSNNIICEHWDFCKKIKGKIFLVKNSKALWYMDKNIPNNLNDKKKFYIDIYDYFNLKL